MIGNWLQTLATLPPAADVALKITAILALGWAAHALLRRRNPRWRVLLWRGVALGLLAAPAIALLLPAIRIAVEPPARPAPPLPPAAIPVPDWMLQQKQLPPVPAATPASATQIQTPAPAPAIDWRALLRAHGWALLAALWAAVAAARALPLLRARRALRRILAASSPAPQSLCATMAALAARLGCREGVALRLSPAAPAPFLCGALHPAIVLPETMAAPDYRDELPAILAHELAHTRSRDVLWGNALHLLGIALWFHPLAWRLRAAHAAACEEVCDAVAAGAVGGALSYSGTLARVALEMAGARLATGVIPMARTADVRRRIEFLRERIYSMPLARRWMALAALTGLCVITAIAGVKLVLAEPAPKPGAAQAAAKKSAPRLQLRLVAQDPKQAGAEPFPLVPDPRHPQSGNALWLEKEILFSEQDIAEAALEPLRDPQDSENRLSLTLTPEAANRFAEVTAKNINRRLAFVFDGRILTAPILKERIGEGQLMITGPSREALLTALRAIRSAAGFDQRARQYADSQPTWGPCRICTFSAGIFFDLDKGKGVPEEPPASNRGGQGDMKEKYDWLSRNGLDLAPPPGGERALRGFDLLVLHYPNSAFTALKPEALLNNEFFKFAKPGTQTDLTPAKDLPATFGFKTREGGVGLLQVTSLTTTPVTGATFSYKLALPAKSGQPAQTQPVPKPRAGADVVPPDRDPTDPRATPEERLERQKALIMERIRKRQAMQDATERQTPPAAPPAASRTNAQPTSATARTLRGKVQTPAGQPIAGAEVFLCDEPHHLFDINERMEDFGPTHFDRDRKRAATAADGSFELMADAQNFTLVIHDPTGLALLDQADFKNGAAIVLPPYGRVEGVALEGRQPKANATIRISRPPDAAFIEDAPIIMFGYTARTDGQGRFVFAQVPAGHVLIGVDPPMMHIRHPELPFEVKPGATARVQLGGTGRALTGQVALAAGSAAYPLNRCEGTIELEVNLAPPRPPREVVAQGGEAITRWLKAWQKSPAGSEWAAQRRGVLDFAVAPDGRFRIPDLPAGKYVVLLMAYQPGTATVLGKVMRTVEIPPIPGGRSDEPLDLGTLEIPVVAFTPSRAPAPALPPAPGVIPPDQDPNDPKATPQERLERQKALIMRRIQSRQAMSEATTPPPFRK